MCWKGKKPIKRIAKEDIEVFKIVYANADSIISAFRDFPYELGKKYTSELEEPKVFDVYFRIDVGLHSYSNKCIIRSEPKWYKIFSPSEEFCCNYHTWLLLRESLYYAQKLTCTIPKGAEYYINDDGEIVSNQLITVRLEEIKS